MLSTMIRLHKAACKRISSTYHPCIYIQSHTIFASVRQKPVVQECNVIDLTSTIVSESLNNIANITNEPVILTKSLSKSSKRIKSLIPQPTYTIQHYIQQTQHITVSYAYLIGFDINTNGVGYSIIDTNYTYIDSGYIDISTLDNTYTKSQCLYNELLLKLYDKYNTASCYIIIEDYLKLYSGLKFNIKYLFDLAEINSIFTYHCQQLYQSNNQCTVDKYHPNIARGTFGLKKCKLDKLSDIKHIVHNFVKPLFPMDYLWKQRKKKNALMDTEYDICDSMLLCCAKLYQLKQTQLTVLQSINTINKQHI